MDNLPSDIAGLQAMVQELLGIISGLRSKVSNLEGRLGLHSQNSSKPPSKDNFTKKVNRRLREKSGKKVRGQPGQEGTSLKFSVPDAVMALKVAECSFCGTSLTEVASKRRVRRQASDLPENFHPQTVEYQYVRILCKKTVENFPAGVNSTIQYGGRLLGLRVYLHLWHGLTYQHCIHFLQTSFGIRLSPARLERVEKTTPAGLTKENGATLVDFRSDVVTCQDETGIRVGQ